MKKNKKSMIFKDRVHAAQLLAEKLVEYKNQKNTIILGLARGGLILAYTIAQKLNLPFDIIIPRKIPAPFNEELAIGALVQDHILLNAELIEDLAVTEDYVQKAIEKEKKMAIKRKQLYLREKQSLDLKNKTVLLIDDGIATGYTMLACIEYLKTQTQNIIVAVPVSPKETLEKIKKEVRRAICLSTPANFMAVGQFYDHFAEVSDEEIIKIMSHR